MKIKKIVFSSIAFIAISIPLLAQDNIEVLQQQSTMIFMKKIHDLEIRVNNLENGQLKNQIEINSLKKLTGDVQTSITSLKDTKKIKEPNFIKVPMKQNLNENFTKKLYRINKNALVFSREMDTRSLSKKISKNLFVSIVKKGRYRSETSSGKWISNKNLEKVDNQKFRKGIFYVVNTYMANVRNGAGANHQISSVLYKNDIVLITGEKKAKDGGIWCKTNVGTYINKRIISKVKSQ